MLHKHKAEVFLRVKLAGALAAVLVLAGTAPASGSPLETPTSSSISHDEWDTEVADALVEHFRSAPHDIEGAKELATAMGGELSVSGDLARPQWIEPFDWPVDPFEVSLLTFVNGPGDPTVLLMGLTNWRDDFLGQGPPENIQTIAVDKECGQFEDYRTDTFNYLGNATFAEGTDTPLSTLRDGGTTTRSPAWNIYDYVTNFQNQADISMTSVVFDRSTCPEDEKAFQAEMRYEANEGGGILDVGLGWGALSVSYDGGTRGAQRSTGAVTVPN